MFAAGLGRPVPHLPADLLQVQVARLRAMPPPWGTALVPDVPVPVPALVVTGGWSPLYEETAGALAVLGARHVIMPGRGHRVQDGQGATVLLQEFWSALPSAAL
jgi:hypothetical protein